MEYLRQIWSTHEKVKDAVKNNIDFFRVENQWGNGQKTLPFRQMSANLELGSEICKQLIRKQVGPSLIELFL